MYLVSSTYNTARGVFRVGGGGHSDHSLLISLFFGVVDKQTNRRNGCAPPPRRVEGHDTRIFLIFRGHVMSFFSSSVLPVGDFRYIAVVILVIEKDRGKWHRTDSDGDETTGSLKRQRSTYCILAAGRQPLMVNGG